MKYQALGALLSTALFLPFATAQETQQTPEILRKASELVQKGDFATALEMLRTEAEKGSADAANALGELLLAGRTGKPAPVEAAKYFEKASEAAHPPASFNLSRLLESGAEGVPKDEDRARFLLQASAEAGYAPAQTRIGISLETAANRTDGDTGSFAEAREWYEKAAAQGEAAALLALVRFYDQGLGGAAAAPDQATDFCLRATRAGSVVAMNEMGVRYQKGTGIRQDNVAAIGWFTLAAQYDLPAAHVNLGNCYEIGNGVRPDYDKAGSHYAAAARQGYAPGQLLLAQLFESGRGTKVNLVNAYVLFSRAAAGGLTAAAERRDAVKGKLTPEQLEEASNLLKAGIAPNEAAR